MSGAEVWPEIEREPVVQCRIFSVERSVARSPSDGTTHTFHRIHAPSWAQIIPITVDGEVVLVRQYRHGAQRITLEIPAGLVDPNEDPAAAAMRECLEETGYRASHAESLGSVNPNSALFANRLYSFLARDVTPSGAIQNTPTERTEVVLVPLAELPRLLESGEIDHALVAATLWRFLYVHRDR